jgi:hypothetical protein
MRTIYGRELLAAIENYRRCVDRAWKIFRVLALGTATRCAVFRGGATLQISFIVISMCVTCWKAEVSLLYFLISRCWCFNSELPNHGVEGPLVFRGFNTPWTIHPSITGANGS